MNKGRVFKHLFKDILWKIIFCILFFIFLVFLIIFSGRVENINQTIQRNQKYIDLDIQEITLERYNNFFDTQVKDNLKIPQSKFDDFWQENLSANGNLGSTVALNEMLADEEVQIVFVLGKAYKLSNYIPKQSTELLISKDIDGEVLSAISSRFTAENKAYVPENFYLNSKTDIYTDATQNTIFIFTNDYMNMARQFNRALYSDMLWDNMIADVKNADLVDRLQNYAWEVYGGHCKVEPYLESSTNNANQEINSYKLMIVFYFLCIIAITIICVVSILNLLRRRLKEFLVYRQFGASKLETYLSILFYVISYLLPAPILTVLTINILFQGFLENYLTVQIAVILLSLVFSVLFSKYVSTRIEDNFTESRSMIND